MRAEICLVRYGVKYYVDEYCSVYCSMPLYPELALKLESATLHSLSMMHSGGGRFSLVTESVSEFASSLLSYHSDLKANTQYA